MKRHFFKEIIVFIVSLMVLFLFTSKVAATDYYVSFSDGNDSNNGTSLSSAWKTLTKVESFSFAPGDNIFLKRGDSWREDLRFPVSGSDGKVIKVSAYGAGTDKPTIFGSMIVDAWQNADNSFKYPYSGVCLNMLEDGRPLKKAESVNSLLPGYWWQDGSYLYYKPTQGLPSDHVVERCSKGACIFLYEKSYIVVEGLRLYGGNSFGVVVRNGHDIKIEGCDVTASGTVGIEILRTDESANCSNIVIKNCLVTWNANGIYIEGADGGYGSRGYDDCEILDNEIAYNNYHDKQAHLTIDGHAVGLQNSNKFVISGNYIHHNYSGIALWTPANYTCNNNVITKNFIYSNELFGAAHGGEGANNSYGNTWAWNIIVDNGNAVEKLWGGMRINRDNSNFFIHNTLVGNDVNFYLYSVTDHQTIKNNISVDPELYHMVIDSSAGSGNVVDSNLYYSAKEPKFMFRGSEVISFEGWQQLSFVDSKSFYSNPKFIVNTDRSDANYYKLADGSNAIDAGEEGLTSIKGDYFDRSVVGKPDLGAVESGAEALLTPPSNLRLSQ